MNWFNIITSLSFLFLVSCISDKKSSCQIDHEKSSSDISSASQLQIYELREGSKALVTIDPNGKTSTIGIDMPSNEACSLTITSEINKIIVFSATHVYMLDTLNALDRVIGFSESHYTANQKLLNKIDQGKVKLYGEFETCDLEALVMSGAELIIISGGMDQSEKIEQLNKAGIVVLQNFEWLEKSPLGRAEWIKFFGAITGNSRLADSIFDGIKTNYNELKLHAKADSTELANFLYGFGGSAGWYVPGGRSFMALLFDDAGISYPWGKNNELGGVNKSYESIALKSKNAHIWISPGFSSKKDILTADNRFSEFQAFKNGSIYNYDKRVGSNGTTEFWEKSVLRCDLLLSDFINMKKAKDGELYFFRKLD